MVLDLGCGYCEFINQVQGAAKFGMDLNPEARKRASADVQILEQDCSKPWSVPSASLTTVFTSNFLEHLPTKAHVEETLMHAHTALRDGGYLIAMGPNVRLVPGAYWDFFDHYVALTDRSMKEILTKCGFELELCLARFLPYSMSQGRTYPSVDAARLPCDAGCVAVIRKTIPGGCEKDLTGQEIRPCFWALRAVQLNCG